MATRGASRWDDKVHYYDYTSDTLRREPRSDEFVVAEAFIYDGNKTEVKTAITVLVSGLEMDWMPRDEAIRRGEIVRDQAVAKYRAQVPTQHPAMLRYDLRGQHRGGLYRSANKRLPRAPSDQQAFPGPGCDSRGVSRRKD